MALEGEIIKSGDQADVLQVDASANRVAGEIVQVGGLAGIVLPLDSNSAQSGDRIAVDTGAQVKINSVEASTTFSEGNLVGWNDTADEAVTSGATTEDFKLGSAIEATSSGGDAVKVALNRQAVS